MAYTLQLLIHYFGFDQTQRERWVIKPRNLVLWNKKIPDYIINGIVNNKEYSKILVECKIFDGDSYYAILRQLLDSGLFTIGMIGDSTD